MWTQLCVKWVRGRKLAGVWWGRGRLAAEWSQPHPAMSLSPSSGPSVSSLTLTAASIRGGLQRVRTSGLGVFP